MAMPPSPIHINQLSGTDFRAALASLVSKVDRNELSPVQGFDVLVTAAAEFKPVKSSGIETPAYTETRVKSQALDEAFDAIVSRALASLPAGAAARKADLHHLYTKLSPFAQRPDQGETRWMGTNLNQLLYRIAKQQELAGEPRP